MALQSITIVEILALRDKAESHGSGKSNNVQIIPKFLPSVIKNPFFRFLFMRVSDRLRELRQNDCYIQKKYDMILIGKIKL